MMLVLFKRFIAFARAPEYAHATDSGADLRWAEDIAGITLYSGDTRRFWCGVGMRLPEGTELQIRPRSSMSAKGILCHLGTCDESYVGQVAVVLTNLSREPVTIQRGDKIAQAVLCPRIAGVKYAETDELGNTERQDRGFGSSGAK